MINGVNVWLAILCAVVAGALCGAVTGFFHIVLGIPAILAGILTQLMLWSVNLKIMGKANVALPSRSVKVLLTQMEIPSALIVIAVFAVALIVILYAFFGTEIGCAVRATGSNGAMSRAQGVNTNIMKLLGLSLSNALVALSGALLAQYQGFSDINMGRGAIVIGLASVIIGEAVLSHISRNFALKLLGMFAGAVIYYIVYQTVIFIGLDTDLLKMFSALVVAVFLGAPYVKKTYFTRQKGGAKNA